LSRQWALVGLNLMGEQFGSDANRARPDPGLDEEDCEAEADGDHGSDEQQRNCSSEMRIGQAGREEQHDDGANEHGRQHRKEDRAADQRHSPVEDADLAQPAIMLRAAAGEEERLDFPGAIDDPGQASGADIQERADAREQEDGRDRQLDDLSNGRDGRRRGREHGAHHAMSALVVKVSRREIHISR